MAISMTIGMPVVLNLDEGFGNERSEKPLMKHLVMGVLGTTAVLESVLSA